MSMESSVACKATDAGFSPFGGAPVAPCEVLRSIRTSSWDFSGGGAIRSSLLIFPEMIEVLLNRKTSN